MENSEKRRRARKINLWTSISELFKNTEEQMGWRRYSETRLEQRVKKKLLMRHRKESEDEKIQRSKEIRK